MKATPRLLIGRTITDVSMNPFPAREEGNATANDPIITLDNGAHLRFVTQETDFGEYGTEICYFPNRKRRNRERS